MSIQAHVEPLNGALPGLTWRWDPETDILSGGFKCARKANGLTGTVELSDEMGSIAVLDVAGGVICGLDIVVWPEVETRGGLKVPETLTDGRVVVPTREARTSVQSLQVDATLAVVADSSESLFHLQIGNRRPAEVVRVADHLYIEVDQQSLLAGFWLTGVPPFPSIEDEL
jgi:hypothetical protein